MVDWNEVTRKQIDFSEKQTELMAKQVELQKQQQIALNQQTDILNRTKNIYWWLLMITIFGFSMTGLIAIYDRLDFFIIDAGLLGYFRIILVVLVAFITFVLLNEGRKMWERR